MGNKNLTVVLVVVILLALGLITYWFVKKGQAPTTPTVPEAPQGPTIVPPPVTPEAPAPATRTVPSPATP